MRKLSIAVAATAFAAFCGAASAGETAKAAAPVSVTSTATMKTGATFWMPSDIKWEADPEMKGVSMAKLWGDPMTGPYGALEKWAGGTDAPLHTHSLDARAVMLSGTLIITMEGQPAKELTAGSAGIVPGHAKHTTQCKAGAECVFFIEQPGKFDMIPAVQPASAPMKK